MNEYFPAQFLITHRLSHNETSTYVNKNTQKIVCWLTYVHTRNTRTNVNNPVSHYLTEKATIAAAQSRPGVTLPPRPVPAATPPRHVAASLTTLRRWDQPLPGLNSIYL